MNVESNPKREGSKAHAAFSHYEDGMTVGEYCDAMEKDGIGKEATPNLVYDAKKGFITIEGYEVPGGVEPPKVREPKAPKEPKATKGKKAEAKEDPEAAAETEEETAD